jgi:hypothetical protein
MAQKEDMVIQGTAGRVRKDELPAAIAPMTASAPEVETVMAEAEPIPTPKKTRKRKTKKK